jgi:hypothetical protein
MPSKVHKLFTVYVMSYFYNPGRSAVCSFQDMTICGNIKIVLHNYEQTMNAK